MAFLSKYGEARTIQVPIIKRAVVDFAVGADWTPGAGDVKITKDGGAAANVANLPTALAMGNTALWVFSLTATEMQAARVEVTVADAATKAVEDTAFAIETYGNASAQHAFDLDTASTAQTGDSFARLGAPAGASVSADIAAIEAQTDDIGVAGAGLTAIPWNAAWDAEVESEVDDALGAGTGTSLTAIPWNAAWDAEVQSEAEDALVVHRLDELLNADSDIDGLAPPTVGSVFHELLTKTAGSFTYDQTTDSLEAVKDTLGTPAGASVSADLVVIDDFVDALETRIPATLSELAQAAPPATPTVAEALMLIYMALRNQLTTTSTTMSITNDAGTVICKSTLSDDGTTHTRAELVAGP